MVQPASVFEPDSLRRAAETGKLDTDEFPGHLTAYSNIELRNLIRELRRSFEYFHMHRRGEQIKKIVLHGGGGTIRGMADFISAALQEEVLVCDPFKWLEHKEFGDENAVSDKALYLVATGLALRCMV